MVIELYDIPLSPLCRSVLMTLKLLNLPVEVKTLNFREGEHMKPEFLKINPFHCMPTLVDDGFAVWESRAIMTYLVNKYAAGNDLYPSDVKVRATVDRWLYWDAGSLYPALVNTYYIPIFRLKAQPDPVAAQSYLDKLKLLDEALASSKYVCGDKMTLADLALLASVVSAHSSGLESTPFANVTKWLKQLEADIPRPIWEELVTQPMAGISQLFKKETA